MPADPTDSPLVTIVTPAYNEEKLLSECIESVLAQSYTNWDYLIVNNCSEDGTLAIAEKYAASDGRIRVVSNSSLLPAVANFNSALRQIRPDSKYAKILFADDWMFPECLERMVSLAEANPSVGIVGAYGHQGQVVLWTGVPFPDKVLRGREICRAVPTCSVRRPRSCFARTWSGTAILSTTKPTRMPPTVKPVSIC